MNNSGWIVIFIILFCIILPQRRRRKNAAILKALKMKKGVNKMNELVKEYIGRDVILTTIDGTAADGVLESVSDEWAMVKSFNGEKNIAVNLSFVTRVREYPKNKKGKRASIVAD